LAGAACSAEISGGGGRNSQQLLLLRRIIVVLAARLFLSLAATLRRAFTLHFSPAALSLSQTRGVGGCW